MNGKSSAEVWKRTESKRTPRSRTTLSINNHQNHVPQSIEQSSNVAARKALINNSSNVRRRNSPHLLESLLSDCPPLHCPIPDRLLQDNRRSWILIVQNGNKASLFTVLTIVHLPMHTSLRKQCAGILLHCPSDLGAGRQIGEETALECGTEDEFVIGGDEELIGARVDVWEEDAAWSQGAGVDGEAGAD
jgi:hypothetical protein